MDQKDKHIVILPYYCDQEISRYLKIADRLKSFPEPVGGYHFLLAASHQTRPSDELADCYSKIGEVIPMSCPTKQSGYPEGPTAMFWDCMDYLAQHFSNNRGFALWMESDMAPTRPDWIDRLSKEWFTDEPGSKGNPKGGAKGTTPIMMGCYVPEVYKHRLFKQKKLLLHAHINGGACYSMDFARHMPPSARQGVFDMAVFQYAHELGRIRATRQIAFSTLSRVRRDLLDDSKVLLHGFMQDKDQFIEGCCDPITDQERRAVVWHPMMDRWELLARKVRVQFVRRGHRAMLENMFLAKREFEQGRV